jgi:predicted transcriptional regulator
MVMTTIQLSDKVKQRLEGFKMDPRETYETVIDRLMNYCDDDDYLSEQDIKDIEKSMEDIKAGRVYTNDEVRVHLGLKPFDKDWKKVAEKSKMRAKSSAKRK